MDRTDAEQATKDELLEVAADRDVEGRSTMTKAELVDALAGPAVVTPVEAGGIDPRLVQARDALRAREAEEAETVETRPTAVALPDELARIREETRQTDGQTRSVRDTPDA